MADYDLKTALKRVSTRPTNFVLIKGATGEQVYISPQPASAKQLTPIMDECGKGKRIAAGICLMESNQLVFKTKTAPSPAWAALVTKVFKSHQCGQYLPAGWRQLGEEESDETASEEGDGEAKSSTPSPTKTAVPAPKPAATKAPVATDPMAVFTKRFGVMLPKIKTAIAAASPAAKELKLKASEAGFFAKKKDFTQANRLLDEVDGMLKKEVAPSSPPKAPPTKSAPPQKPDTAGKTAVPEAPPAPPTLTTYVKAKRDWIAAKAASAKGTAALKAAILKECDPELESAVKARLDQWDGMLAIMDDDIIAKIDHAIKEADAEQQAEHNRRLATALAQMQDALHKHPFAPVADSNPFGKFSIRAPLEQVLTKLGAAFSA